jgi:cephalosporin hydroxylase
VDPAVVARVRAQIRPGERVLVVLDSNHTKAHVLGELEAYGPLVTVGSYLVVADGVVEDLAGVPGAAAYFARDNPKQAVAEFLARHEEFALDPPPRPFNESRVTAAVTYWPDGYLRRTR